MMLTKPQITIGWIAKCILASTTAALVIWFALQSQFCHLDSYFEKHLFQMRDILDANGIKFWLNGGALLGFLRNQALLPWDYDIDLNVLEEEIPKIEKLKTTFESLGYEMFTRNDYIPYKGNHKITTPALILYIKPSLPQLSPVRFHIEFYDWKTMTKNQAKKRGYKLPSDKNEFSDKTKVICNVEALEEEGLEKCLRKSRVFPLQVWEHKAYDQTWLMPQDTNYCASEPFGKNWITPTIKGWKQPLCYEYWTDYNELITVAAILFWYMVWISVLHYSWNVGSNNTSSKTNKYYKVSSDEFTPDREVQHRRSSTLSNLFDLDNIHISTPPSTRNNAQCENVHYRGSTPGSSFWFNVESPRVANRSSQFSFQTVTV